MYIVVRFLCKKPIKIQIYSEHVHLHCWRSAKSTELANLLANLIFVFAVGGDFFVVAWNVDLRSPRKRR